jgi:hypothetical protein
MKKALLAIAFITYASCSQTGEQTRIITGERYLLDDRFSPLQVVVIDNCEYLWGNWGYKTVLTHKGNCPNH